MKNKDNIDLRIKYGQTAGNVGNSIHYGNSGGLQGECAATATHLKPHYCSPVNRPAEKEVALK